MLCAKKQEEWMILPTVLEEQPSGSKKRGSLRDVDVQRTISKHSLVADSATVSDVLVMMQQANKPAFVAQREADWVLEMATCFCNEPDDVYLSLVMAIGFWYFCKQAEPKFGILRSPLIERLDLEMRFRSACLRLLNVVCMFALLTFALARAGASDRCRGI